MKKTILLILTFFLPWLAHGQTIYSTDFDSGSFGSGFSANYCNFDWSCRVVDSPAGKPGKSLKTEFRLADCTGARETNGDELKVTAGSGWDNYDVWIGGRIYINSNTFGYDDDRLMIFQHHGYPDSGEVWRQPIISLLYEEEELALTAAACSEQIMTNGDECYGGPLEYRPWMEYAGTPNQDAWNDIIIHGKLYYSEASGEINIWLNGTKTYASDSHLLGYYDTQNGGYFKFGVYSGNCIADATPRREAFFDDIKACYGNSCDLCDVLPTGAIVPSGYSCP